MEGETKQMEGETKQQQSHHISAGLLRSGKIKNFVYLNLVRRNITIRLAAQD